MPGRACVLRAGTHQKGPLMPYSQATLDDCRSVAAHVLQQGARSCQYHIGLQAIAIRNKNPPALLELIDAAA